MIESILKTKERKPWMKPEEKYMFTNEVGITHMFTERPIVNDTTKLFKIVDPK